MYCECVVSVLRVCCECAGVVMLCLMVLVSAVGRSAGRRVNPVYQSSVVVDSGSVLLYIVYTLTLLLSLTIIFCSG